MSRGLRLIIMSFCCYGNCGRRQAQHCPLLLDLNHCPAAMTDSPITHLPPLISGQDNDMLCYNTLVLSNNILITCVYSSGYFLSYCYLLLGNFHILVETVWSGTQCSSTLSKCHACNSFLLLIKALYVQMTRWMCMDRPQRFAVEPWKDMGYGIEKKWIILLFISYSVFPHLIDNIQNGNVI